jgi:hypothetical protein
LLFFKTALLDRAEVRFAFPEKKVSFKNWKSVVSHRVYRDRIEEGGKNKKAYLKRVKRIKT